MTNIRGAQLQDLESIVAIDPIDASDPHRQQFIRRSIESKECWVYEDASGVLGFGILNYSFFECGFVALLAVHPAHRRCGIGSRIMQYLESECNNPKLFTSTNQSNTPMQALLSKLGYQPSGMVENLDEGDPECIYFKEPG